jgi:hypothetical protein
MANLAGWAEGHAPVCTGLMIVGVGRQRRGRQLVRPAALVPVAELPKWQWLVAVNLDHVRTIHAVMATVSEVALRALRRQGKTRLMPPPVAAARVVGTVTMVIYATGHTVAGRSWVWGDVSSAPPAPMPVGCRFRRGCVSHHFHTTAALGAPCSLCDTRHTGGADECHRCILASPAYIPTTPSLLTPP